jgi:hypothetical protein
MTTMINGFDNFDKLSKDNVDVAMKSADAFTKGLQAIATESADYSKRSFEAGSEAFEKLLAAKSLDAAVEVQTDFVRTAYEGYVGQMSKVSEIFQDMAKSAYKPYEGLMGKFGG